jgi:hypothetical protein
MVHFWWVIKETGIGLIIGKARNLYRFIPQGSRLTPHASPLTPHSPYDQAFFS